MTEANRQPLLLARAQALDTWAAGRERAIEKLVCEAEALEGHDLTEQAARLWHAAFRLQKKAHEQTHPALLQNFPFWRCIYHIRWRASYNCVKTNE